MKTDLIVGLLEKEGSGLVDNWIKDIPMGRMAHPSELQGTIVWMASDASSYLNGSDVVSLEDWPMEMILTETDCRWRLYLLLDLSLEFAVDVEMFCIPHGCASGVFVIFSTSRPFTGQRDLTANRCPPENIVTSLVHPLAFPSIYPAHHATFAKFPQLSISCLLDDRGAESKLSSPPFFSHAPGTQGATISQAE